jgi:hypothetical protein
MKVRKGARSHPRQAVRGAQAPRRPVLHGKPFTEHRNVPVLTINLRNSRPAWRQVTATLTEAIRSGILVPGDELPSIQCL